MSIEKLVRESLEAAGIDAEILREIPVGDHTRRFEAEYEGGVLNILSDHGRVYVTDKDCDCIQCTPVPPTDELN